MSARILVINPNSTQAVTDGIAQAIAGLAVPGGPQIDCLTLAEGPPGIESQQHVDGVVTPLCNLIRREAADAYVIACYSDPGLHSAREVTEQPVLGISESGLLTACTMGERFGVVSILAKSIPRHLRAVRQMGLWDRMAGDRALGLGVVELADRGRVFDRMVSVAINLRDQDGADVLVLGCAGMAYLRADLEAAVGIPVVDPTQAAVSMALGRVLLAQADTVAKQAAE
ncbi:aspartate/glutamate racemase family protein [Hwanghaeella sp.]|uniref:aspartate/glutamate racemase family protein n=1 Tax=Hwanghaeella sp. TaxID=2605943 RepID=UPI003CCBE245